MQTLEMDAPTFNNLQEDFLAAIEQGDLAMLVAAPPIAFQRVFVDITGSATAALLLSACMQDQENRVSSPDGWYAASADTWQALTGLTRKEQSTARRVLRDLQLLHERRTGYPAQFEIRVDYNEITRCLLALTKKRPRALGVAVASPVTH